jgi:hypothetical protein
MEPIETVYKGYRFRSRLEARWAVFLDKLGIPYQYEKEGFELDGEWYLPDFWLPLPEADERHTGSGYWLEIKPLSLSEREKWLLGRLVRDTGHNAYAFAGNVGFKEFEVTKWELRRQTGEVMMFKIEEPDDYLWLYANLALFNQWDMKCNIVDAFNAARSAQFEHGKKGI